MINHNGNKYYTCTELSKILNNPTSDEFQQVADKFREVYSKSNSFIYDSYIQQKLFNACDKKLIKYIRFQKKGPTVYRAFSMNDLMDFLNKAEAKNICVKTNNIRNIEVVEVEK